MREIPKIKESRLSLYRNFNKDALLYTRDLLRRYGDLFSFKAKSTDFIYANKPEFTKEIFVTKFQYFRKPIAIIKLLQELNIGVRGIFFNNDLNTWQKDRNAITPAFSTKHFKEYTQKIIAVNEKMINKIDHSIKNHPLMNIRDIFTQITLESLLSCFFGGAQLDIHKTSIAFRKILELNANYIRSLFPQLWKLHPKQRAHILNAKNTIYATSSNLIHNYLDQASSPNNLLHLLISAYGSMKDQENFSAVFDNVATLILAGHETTACLLTWTLCLLSQHPQTERILLDEISSVIGNRTPEYHDLEKMPYLKGVIYECLRLYPPVPNIPRMAINEQCIHQYRFPQKSYTILPIYHLHRNPNYWSNPEGFDPLRFTNSEFGQSNEYAYCPFGAGPRSCIGSNFALLEAKLTLIQLLQNFHFALLADERPSTSSRKLVILCEPCEQLVSQLSGISWNWLVIYISVHKPSWRSRILSVPNAHKFAKGH
jgi:cytochrome P450